MSVRRGTPGSDSPVEVASTLWQRLTPEDELLAEPTEFPPPLTDPAPTVLNIDQVPWPTFERLVLRMARDVDGASDPQIFGNPGQRQDGIDVVATIDGDATVYQVKRYQKFTALDLEKAIKKYAVGKRPFKAKRLVVAVACGCDDTTLRTKLDALRRRYRSLEIELWDQTDISLKLEKYPDIVRRFFGAATMRSFLRVDEDFRSDAPVVESDALIRGPIRHLGLEEALRDANEQIETNPLSAALQLGKIAERLDESPFGGHSVMVRDRQLTALERTGDRDAQAALTIPIVWQLVASGDHFKAEQLLGRLHNADVADENLRSLHTADAAVALRRDFGATFDSYLAFFDLLVPTDVCFLSATLFMAEEAVAVHRLSAIRDRWSALEASIRIGTQHGDERSVVRLRMCMADASGDWGQLSRDARCVNAGRKSEHLAA